MPTIATAATATRNRHTPEHVTWRSILWNK
jgi:hypothetical protein